MTWLSQMQKKKKHAAIARLGFLSLSKHIADMLALPGPKPVSIGLNGSHRTPGLQDPPNRGG